MSETVHVFLDTNTALHFRRADEIDWPALTRAPRVVLVVAPMLLGELEQQKIHNPSRKLRERAEKTVKWLAGLLRDEATRDVRPGVTLKFLDSEPQVDFCAHSLSPSIPDDRLIASALEYQAGTHETVVVCTGDIGLEAKLHHRPIDPLILPDNLKLPAEPDPVEKELRETQRKLRRLESRLPLLHLSFEGGTDRLELPPGAVRATATAPTLSEIQALHPSLEGGSDSRPELQTEAQRMLSLALRSSGLSKDQIDRHNQKLQQFYSDYSAYRDKLAAWGEQTARTVWVELVLCNRGSAPASDVDAVINFPDDLRLIEREKLPERPSPPEPPIRPTPFGLGEMREALSRLHSSDALDRIAAYPAFDPSAPFVEQHQIRFSLNRLKHGFKEPLQAFYFRFPDRSAIRSFSIDFQLSAAELADAKVGKLHIVVSTG